MSRLLNSLRRYSPARVSAWKWLYVGIGVKRWLVLLMAGVTFLSLGVAYFLVEIYREQPFPDFVYYLTLQFLPAHCGQSCLVRLASALWPLRCIN